MFPQVDDEQNFVDYKKKLGWINSLNMLSK